MYVYSAYGLGICSPILLPELQADEGGNVDVIISIEKVDLSRLPAIDREDYSYVYEKDVYIVWKQLGIFLVRDGKEIIVDPCDNVDESYLRLVILGAALAALLHQRGLLILHASAVNINNRVIAFVGDKGWGKSTMAAALCVRGHQLMADDIVALNFATGSAPMVLPGFPQLKLWPDAADAVGYDSEVLPLLNVGGVKRAQRFEKYSSSSLPLSRLYVLAIGHKIEIEPLSRPQALT